MQNSARYLRKQYTCALNRNSSKTIVTNNIIVIFFCGHSLRDEKELLPLALGSI